MRSVGLAPVDADSQKRQAAALQFDVGHATNISVLEHLWVRDDYQGKGIGRALYAFVDSLQREVHKIELISCVVDPKTRSGGAAMYERRNYTETSSERRAQLADARPHYHMTYGSATSAPGRLGQLALLRRKV